MKIDLSNALEMLGSAALFPIEALLSALLEQAAEKLLIGITCQYPDHPDQQAKCAELAATITKAVKCREEITEPDEGWFYWFSEWSDFLAYQNALALSKLDA